MGELLLNDYSRRGFLDGIGIRLPTICIRPGLPNKAASGFFSNILREPLVGKEAVLPVAEDVRHWHASPRAAVGFLRHALTLRHRALGRAAQPERCRASRPRWASRSRRCAASAGDDGGGADPPRARPDDRRASSPAGRRASTRAARSALGFIADASFDAIIAPHVEDELGGGIGPG